MPYLAAMTHHCRNRELTVRMTARYDLDAEHVAFITGSGKTTNKVQGIVEEAEDRLGAETVEHSGGAFAAVEDAADEAEENDDGTLASFGAVDADDGDDDPGDAATEERADAADDDDGQSGLSEFM